jgi:hypothetical protein
MEHNRNKSQIIKMKVKHSQIINNLYTQLHFGEEFRYCIRYQDSNSNSITFNLRNFFARNRETL